MEGTQTVDRESPPGPIAPVPLRCAGSNGHRPCGRLLGIAYNTEGRVEIKCPRCYHLNSFTLAK